MYNDIEALKFAIRHLCDKQNITINKLATLSGITQSTIDSIMKGRSNNPKIATLNKLSHGFGIEFEEFLLIIDSYQADSKNPPIFESVSRPDRVILKTASTRLRQLRQDKGITLYEVVKATNVHRHYETGSYGMEEISALVTLADFFDCSVDYLIGRTDNPSLCKLDSPDECAETLCPDCGNAVK